MLKWTASAQKLTQHQSNFTSTPSAISMLRSTPIANNAKRRQRRATIANKENIPIVTSTPMVSSQFRARNSPMVTAPLSDILNVTPEPVKAQATPERHRRVQNQRVRQTRRHSTIGLTLPTAVPHFARTLPRYEEEYSPSTDLPSGQHLALRGLVPAPFVANTRYFTTPDIVRKTQHIDCEFSALENKALPTKRTLGPIFAELAKECPASKKSQAKVLNSTNLSSTKMGDETLDKLIDAILDSARKEDKDTKKSRKSFNLRRRTLLKNQAECSNELILSPSYAAGDDPASDLSFLLCEPPTTAKALQFATPKPATPLLGIKLSDTVLRNLPTPVTADALGTTFQLETPLVVKPNKRRKQRAPSDVSTATPPKKFKVDSRNYFEVGLALPSIYV